MQRMLGTEVLDFGTTWTAAGVVVGFSVTAFTFRIGREARKRDDGHAYWLPPADFLLVVSLAVVLIGVFVLPVLGAGLAFARYALGWAFLLLATYPLALAAHYEILLGKPPAAEQRGGWKTPQEEAVVWIAVGGSIAYFVAVAIREAV
jgi:hypothetical protein